MRRHGARTAWLIACYGFLYAPIVFLIVFSFNESRSVTAWSGASLHWYGVLFQDQMLVAAAWLSLRMPSSPA